MKITGIVVEYNPMHQGHLYHLEQARKLTQCDVLIAVMSGNFVQRGEPAIIDKWQRALTALNHGIDIVVELPFASVNQGAQQFAEGAINILQHFNITDLVFGSETNNLEELQDMAEMSINPNNLKEIMDQGYSYPKAYGLMTANMGSNDILAIAYLKALKHTNITAHSIQRQVSQYHDTTLVDSFSSASAIRNALKKQYDISIHTPMAETLSHHDFKLIEDYFLLIRHQLLTQPKTQLYNLALVNEGIENHLQKQALKFSRYEDFINHSITRRYTKSRIQRTLMNILVNVRKTDLDIFFPQTHCRVLGFNQTGRQYLHHLQRSDTIITNFKNLPTSYKQLEYRSTIAYALPHKSDYQQYLLTREKQGPIIL